MRLRVRERWGTTGGRGRPGRNDDSVITVKGATPPTTLDSAVESVTSLTGSYPISITAPGSGFRTLEDLRRYDENGTIAHGERFGGALDGTRTTRGSGHSPYAK